MYNLNKKKSYTTCTHGLSSAPLFFFNKIFKHQIQNETKPFLFFLIDFKYCIEYLICLELFKSQFHKISFKYQTLNRFKVIV